MRSGLLLLTVVAALGLAPAATASARSYGGCWGDAGVVGPNPHGYKWRAKYCHNFTGGDVYKSQYGQYTQKVGYLNAGDNWFVCQDRNNENPPVAQGYKNDIWLYTQGDRATEGTQNAWGKFPANRVSSSTGDYQPIPGLPWCSDIRPLGNAPKGAI
ncbi:hypothetical protein [Nonomuraea sediminis]|uniref:hypothetical protein n=1 Tax=Nonomuraea sediminis TaxID=2835864 RepID=UPI001BDD19A0|nr:hypothetical protein [Nonomuraea sediminis]